MDASRDATKTPTTGPDTTSSHRMIWTPRIVTTGLSDLWLGRGAETGSWVLPKVTGCPSIGPHCGTDGG